MDDNRENKISHDARVRKTLIRNMDAKLPKSSKTVTVIPFTCNIIKSDSLKETKSNSSDDKFTIPQRNSTNIITKKIEAIENKVPKSFINPTDSDMLMVNRKSARKFNFHFDKNIYKDLVALNISNGHKPKFQSSHRNYSLSTSKDIEPNMENFYNDVRECDKSIMVSAVKVKLSPIIRYDATDFYAKMKNE